MKKKLISIKTAIILPFVIIMCVIVITFITLWKLDFDWISKEQGSKLLKLTNENTKQKISFMLAEPLRINQFYNDFISRENIYNQTDMSILQEYTLHLIKNIDSSVPQISVISYGDINKNFIGYRTNNEPNKYDLMLQDIRTSMTLNIYSGDNTNSNIVSSFVGYDPTTRPWFSPVLENKRGQWSDIYVNYDEKMEATISSMLPILDNSGEILGVSDIDIKLSGIQSFLSSDINKGNGSIYIVDKNWNLIAYSGLESTIQITSYNPPSGTLINSTKFSDSIVRESANYLLSKNSMPNEVAQFLIDNNKYFALISVLDKPSDLDWRIVSVIPENDLMGLVKKRQTTTVGIILLLIVLTSLIGLFIMSKVVKPILNSAEAAKAINIDKWDIDLVNTGFNFYETDTLISALNHMSIRLKETFLQILVSEEKYKVLVENINDMIYSLDEFGNFISINNSFEKAFNQNRVDVIGNSLESIFENTETQLYWRQLFDDVSNTKKPINSNFQYKNVNGEFRYLQVNLIPILDKSDSLISILGTNTDITELIEAQNEISRLSEAEKEKLENLVAIRTEELKFAMDELIEKEKLASLGALVSGISHEINTPLGVSISAISFLEQISNTLLKNIENNAVNKSDFITFLNNLIESVDIINTNIFRAASLVRSFKEISVKQSANEKVKFNVKNYVDSTILSLKHEYKNTTHTINLVCDENLEVLSYPGAFSQILTNLIINSLIHGFKDIKYGEINIEFYKNNNNLYWIYKDNGNGISNENISHIFDPFFTTNRNKGGSGLGLNIVYNLVTGQLNGKIKVLSEINKGTTFNIILDLSTEGDM